MVTSGKQAPKKVSAVRKAASESRAQSFSLISDDTFRRMYAAMLGCRKLEERTRRELRRKRSLKQLPVASVSTRPALYQEAVIVGTTIDLRPDDTITAPSGEVVFRAQSMPSRGKPNGRAKVGVQRWTAEARRNLIASAASSGAQLTIGTGVALAYKDSTAQTDGTSNTRIVVAFGDANADSLASWNEALHLSGLYHLPIVFVLRPVSEESGTPASVSAICERAKLAGVAAIPVDAIDVVAMYRVGFESIERARKGTGPTLVVATQFVVDGHDPAEETADPIQRLEAYLIEKGIFTAKWKAEAVRRLK